jgi:hypothetical protein
MSIGKGRLITVTGIKNYIFRKYVLIKPGA